MRGFNAHIKEQTLENDNFRQVLYTTKKSQLMLMCLEPSEEIEMKAYPENDQFFSFEKGEGSFIVDGYVYAVQGGSAIIVPAGAEHNVINTSPTEKLKFYNICSPPRQKDGTIHKTKAEAETDDEGFDGVTTEMV